ncbi:pro-resilin-like [Portunus trituberculatus]|uniref:pro-resilin-like n=1 Tax=Portunus trituberculatus TaxID=210409 RepID=UPI001E1CDCE6|nr:pro-resilin-like [Portunus trituberculatus]
MKESGTSFLDETQGCTRKTASHAAWRGSLHCGYKDPRRAIDVSEQHQHHHHAPPTMWRPMFFLCLAVSAVFAMPGGYAGGHGGVHFGGAGYGGGYGGYSVPTPYAYDYAVSAGVTNFGQSEKGNGYGGVNGGYWVNLPDGRVQKVSYWADGSGYHPVVTYSGKAHYPASYGYGHDYH